MSETTPKTKENLEVPKYQSKVGEIWEKYFRFLGIKKEVEKKFPDNTVALNKTINDIQSLARQLDYPYSPGRLTNPNFDKIDFGELEKEEIACLEGHTDWVRSVAFSPDGNFIVSGSYDKTIRVWDLTDPKNPKELPPLEEHTSWVKSVAFSPDGKYIVSGSDDETIKIWNAKTGTLVNTLTGHTNRVRSVAFSPDGKYIVSGSDDGTIKIWNAKTRDLIKTLTEHTGWLSSVVFSPDGNFIVSGSDDGTIKIWNAKTGIEVDELKPCYVLNFSFSPNGELTIATQKQKVEWINEDSTKNVIVIYKFGKKEEKK